MSSGPIQAHRARICLPADFRGEAQSVSGEADWCVQPGRLAWTGQRWAWARLFIGPVGFLHGCFSNAEQLLHSVRGELALAASRVSSRFCEPLPPKLVQRWRRVTLCVRHVSQGTPAKKNPKTNDASSVKEAWSSPLLACSSLTAD